MPNSTAFSLYQLALVVLLAGALLPLFAWRNNRWSGRLGVVGAMVGSGIGLCGAGIALLDGDVATGQLAWSSLGLNLCLRLDGLAAFFLVPVFMLVFTGALYGSGYLRLPGRSLQGARHWFGFNLLAFSMALLVGAADSLLFLMAWELMSLSSFLLVIFELADEAAKRAGWIYLVASHLGAAFLFFLFLYEYRLAGSTEFSSLTVLAELPTWGTVLFFLLALIGFGTKAELFPLHSWLPEVYSTTSSHVLALMSGVMVKTGIYGFLRILTFLPALPPWCGILAGGLGLAGVLVGIALSSLQNNLRRSLAYSTVESVGLIFIGIGLWIYCRDQGMEVAGTLLLAGALLHIWNHALIKSLLFYGVGALQYATTTRELSKLGGLLRRMPVTSGLLILGGAAIAALPPLNGLIGEWLLYLGLFQAGQASVGGQAFMFLIFLVLLAMAGAMVLFAMTRIIGVALCGEPRSPESMAAHEVGPAMLGAMIIIALACLGIGIMPGWFISLTAAPLTVLAPGVEAGNCLGGLPFGPGWSGAGVLLVLLMGGVSIWRYRSCLGAVGLVTWSGGYFKSLPRTSITAGGFGQLAEEAVYCDCLRPEISGVRKNVLFPGGLAMAKPDLRSGSGPGLYPTF